MNDDCAASERKHKTRMRLVSKEEAHWLEEKLKQSFYDEHIPSKHFGATAKPAVAPIFTLFFGEPFLLAQRIPE